MTPRPARRVLASALIAPGIVSTAWSQTAEIDPNTLMIAGRLSDNRLTFGEIGLTIDGDAMRGAGSDNTITLAKEK